ncbi:TlyA family RNA methyltransferase [Gordonia desulfuricans]|uniref:TlyA family RNA methyltransferase n=1 Tax=Gordonia desulfuricans TaxID=89051 RepID=A0A7K3LUY9_9ACTN|nr:TlyA family RNA methyltransferase [Gordonia desulfuricans]NDK92093.1 TlyA family RNA methyltransferase [Gordonia desulfuricans]
MAARARLDAELVRRGLARSREQARELVDGGMVKVNGVVATKPATNVGKDTPIVLIDDAAKDDWASRGAHKLLGALEAFEPQGLTVGGRRCLDAGASTGGFTDVLLRRDAREIVAVDVGYGQLIWRLQNDPRVDVHDRTNVRHLNAADIGGEVDLVVADLSFISLSLVLPAFVACVWPGADLVPMVKPQFEVGKERVGAGGVVRDPELRVAAVAKVVAEARRLGLQLRGVTASPLPGPSGNVEYFLWLRRPDGELSESEAIVSTGLGEGDDDHRADDHRDPGVLDTAAVEPETLAMIRQAVADGPA